MLGDPSYALKALVRRSQGRREMRKSLRTMLDEPLTEEEQRRHLSVWRLTKWSYESRENIAAENERWR